MAASNVPAVATAVVPAEVCQFTQLTAAGRSAVATIGVWGPQVAACLSRFFLPRQSRPIVEERPGTIRYGRWQQGQGEDLLLVCVADDCWEIHCHGGEIAPESIQADLVAVGCRLGSVSEYAARYGLAASLPRAREAERCLPRATTLKTSLMLLDQTEGALDRAVAELQGLFESGAWAAAKARLANLIAHGRCGVRWERPWQICLVGPPNVGKSSLTNRLLGYERSIVHAEPGTTRDCVSAESAIDGWPVAFCDTAGLRSTTDVLEQAGMEIAQAMMDAADLLLWVGDVRQRSRSAAPWAIDGEARVAQRRAKSLVVWNKIDLLPACPANEAEAAAVEPDSALGGEYWVSAVTGAGIPELLQALARQGIGDAPPPGAAVPFLDWQLQALQNTAERLQAGDLTSAVQSLSQLQRVD